MAFAGDVHGVLARAKESADQAVHLATDGDANRAIDLAKTPLTDWPLSKLRSERDTVKKEVGIDVVRQKKYDDLRRAISKQESGIRRIEENIAKATGASDRRRSLIMRRRQVYSDVFETFVTEEQVLKDLYLPLRTTLETSGGTLAKLSFVVQRQVDIDAWIARGEQLLDLRRESRFRGHGALRHHASEFLLNAWLSGTPADVDTGIDRFRTEFQQDMLNARPSKLGASNKEFGYSPLLTGFMRPAISVCNTALSMTASPLSSFRLARGASCFSCYI